MGVNSPLMTGGYLLSSGLPTAAGTGMGEGGAGGEDGDRQVLGSLAGKENAKHQVLSMATHCHVSSSLACECHKRETREIKMCD